MTKLRTLNDGLLDQLKDLYSAESQLLKALPKMEKKATNPRLKKVFNFHLRETEIQLARLDKIGELVEEKLSGKTCKAMQGLLEEGKEVLEEESENEALLDALLIGAAQRVEHYEMAAYGTALAMADELGQDEISKLLDESLGEEKDADRKLSAIAEGEVLSQANIPIGMNEDKSRFRKEGIRKVGNASRVLTITGCLFISHHAASFVMAEADATAKNVGNNVSYDADNTGRNARDRHLSLATADDQNLAGSDLDVLALVRRKIVDNEKLSTNGRNVKILVENRKVTLRGPVHSAEEKIWIEEATARVATGYGVVNQLEVTSVR